MRLAVAACSNAWLVVNAASAVWNNYLPIMQRERYADLPGILLPVLQTLLQVSATLQLKPVWDACHCRTQLQLMWCALLCCAERAFPRQMPYLSAAGVQSTDGTIASLCVMQPHYSFLKPLSAVCNKCSMPQPVLNV